MPGRARLPHLRFSGHGYVLARLLRAPFHAIRFVWFTFTRCCTRVRCSYRPRAFYVLDSRLVHHICWDYTVVYGLRARTVYTCSCRGRFLRLYLHTVLFPAATQLPAVTCRLPFTLLLPGSLKLPFAWVGLPLPVTTPGLRAVPPYLHWFCTFIRHSYLPLPRSLRTHYRHGYYLPPVYLAPVPPHGSAVVPGLLRSARHPGLRATHRLWFDFYRTFPS